MLSEKIQKGLIDILDLNYTKVIFFKKMLYFF